MNEKALSFLGLLNRGKLTLIGASLLHAHKLYLIVMADDASENTAKEVSSLASRFSCPLVKGVSKEKLGKALGYEELSAVGISEKKAAKALSEKW
jgi:ribosomal protein L7Ae-like RNA K-turn-binding protein